MRQTASVLLVFALLSAGCVGLSDGPTGPDDTLPPAEDEPGTAGAQAPELDAPVNVSKRFPGAEPVVDVGPDGTIYLEGIGQTEAFDETDSVLPPLVNRVWRSTDGGDSWTDVTPPLSGGNASCDGFVAVDGDGTVYVANCYVVAAAGTLASKLEMYRSNDRGDTWERVEVPAFPEPMHRMWIVSNGEDTIELAVEALFPNGGLYHLRSTDDGTTWQGPTPVDLQTYFGSDLAVGPDGTLYAARMLTETTDDYDIRYSGPWRMSVSTDGGLTWTSKEMFALEGELATSWQALTVDPNGTVYMVWAETLEETARLRYAFSTDEGDTWQGPRTIGDADASHTLPWATARDAGELVLTWYEAQEAGPPGATDAAWRGHAGVLSGADTAEPELSSSVATPWALREGPICVKGPSCDGDRELLDYSWVDVGPESRLHLAFASSQWDERSAFPVYVGGQ